MLRKLRTCLGGRLDCLCEHVTVSAWFPMKIRKMRIKCGFGCFAALFLLLICSCKGPEEKCSQFPVSYKIMHGRILTLQDVDVSSYPTRSAISLISDCLKNKKISGRFGESFRFSAKKDNSNIIILVEPQVTSDLYLLFYIDTSGKVVSAYQYSPMDN